jgi:uncharacterized protein YecT (DUF1311 family)
VGSRRTLTSDVDYTVQPAADGSGNVVLLRNADVIIAPLATLARVNQPPAPTVEQTRAAPEQVNEIMPEQPQNAPVPATPEQQPLSAVSSQARPSFDCARAHSKGEVAVCSHAGLAALDRNMATQFRQAMDEATPQQRDLLRKTRDRFVAYRDRCPNRSCIGDAYVGRMREIRDIMDGHWQPQR